MASPVMMIIVMVRITPMRPGTMLYCVLISGIVERMDPQIEGAAAFPADMASGPLRSLCSAVVVSRLKAAMA